MSVQTRSDLIFDAASAAFIYLIEVTNVSYYFVGIYFLGIFQSQAQAMSSFLVTQDSSYFIPSTMLRVPVFFYLTQTEISSASADGFQQRI